MNKSNNIKNGENKELSEIYKIFEEIYLAAPPVLKDLSDSSVDIDYTEFIRDKIDFKKINTKFTNGEYCSITDAIKDIRAVFINCYSFYGARSDHTKKSLKLEAILEEKISCLENDFRLLADVNLTFNLLKMNGKPSSKLRYPKDCYDSILLRNVAHCRPERLKEYHRILSTTLTTDEDNAHILEKILIWENEVYFNDIFHQYISSMWELPEIGNFVAIIFKKLDFEIINQGEIERMFLSPKESTTMSKIMTTLLMPVKKSKFIGQVMPYKVWCEKLSNKISEWCKVYHAKNKNKVNAMNLLGIHPDFWAIVNEKNPLIEKDFCELSYFMKVWLVKGLCDYVTIKFKTINDIVTHCNEKQCTIWKNDLETEEYFFFNTMPDLRVYYYNIPYDEPSLEFLESVKLDKKVEVEDNISANKREKHFKLIADSVEGLRSFVNELDMEGSSVPEDLINALEELIVKIEPEECNFIVLNNDSKIKLFKDWTSYSDRIAKDNISLWTEKDQRSSLVQNQEIIIEKRRRISTIKQDFEKDKYFESDEYFSENDMSITDYSDSEDEWGAMYQSKNKSRQSLQAPSKLVELEKRLTAEGKMPNHDTKKNMKVKCVKNTNTLVNGHNKTSICSTDKDYPSLFEEKNSKLIALAENKEICLKKRQRKFVVHKDFEEKKLYETDDFVSENDMTMTGLTDSEDEWGGTVNQPKFRGKQPSKLVELEKRLMAEGKMPNHDTKKKIINNTTNNKFGSIKNDKSVCLVTVENTENEVKSRNKTNNLVNDHKKILVNSKKNIDSFDCDGEIVLIDSDKEENENPPNNLKNIEVINLDEYKQNDCEIVNDHLETTINNCTENKTKKTSVILIDDEEVEDNKIDQILISDDEDDVQIVSIIQTAKSSPLKINESYTLNNNLKRSYNSVPSYRQTTPSKRQATSITPTQRLSQNISATQRLSQDISATRRLSQNISTTQRFSQNISVTPRLSQNVSLIPRLSNNISIMPANVHVPKGIEITIVKSPQPTMNSHFNSSKRSTIMPNRHIPKNNASTVNVKCEVFSKIDLSGEVKFYIRLPNGKEHPGPNELINEYLKQHNNQLPDYWLVPLSIEVAKQYGL